MHQLFPFLSTLRKGSKNKKKMFSFLAEKLEVQFYPFYTRMNNSTSGLSPLFYSFVTFQKFAAERAT